MTSHIPENFFTWLVDWSPATIMPPRCRRETPTMTTTMMTTSKTPPTRTTPTTRRFPANCSSPTSS